MSYPDYSPIPIAELGSTLADVITRLGKWDPVGDIGPGPDGHPGYPFSNRNGYDYVICVTGLENKVTSAWRRKTANNRIDTYK